MNTKLFQLAKLIMKFSNVSTDKGELIIDGELAINVDVMITDENGEVISAPDGDYLTDDNKTIVIKDGKVVEIKEPINDVIEETLNEDEPINEEPQVDDEKDSLIAELKTKVTELEGLLQDRDAVISELTNKIKDLQDKKPVEEAVKLSAVSQSKFEVKDNPALKYFQD
jgi:hypothetical protein